MTNKKIDKDLPTDQGATIVSRRGFLKFAGASSLATAAGTLASAARAANGAPDGTPEQVHLTWGNDPTSEVTVSWASPAPAVNPQVRLAARARRESTVHGVQSTYTDGINGEVVFTYHARLRG
jgi:Predicted phosphatase